MDRRARRATVHRVAKRLQMTEATDMEMQLHVMIHINYTQNYFYEAKVVSSRTKSSTI